MVINASVALFCWFSGGSFVNNQSVCYWLNSCHSALFLEKFPLENFGSLFAFLWELWESIFRQNDFVSTYKECAWKNKACEKCGEEVTNKMEIRQHGQKTHVTAERIVCSVGK